MAYEKMMTPSERPPELIYTLLDGSSSAPSSNTSIDLLHANSCEELISPRYSTCRCSTPTITQALVLDNAPVAVLFAVLLASRGTQKHDRRLLSAENHPWKQAKSSLQRVFASLTPLHLPQPMSYASSSRKNRSESAKSGYAAAFATKTFWLKFCICIRAGRCRRASSSVAAWRARSTAGTSSWRTVAQ